MACAYGKSGHMEKCTPWAYPVSVYSTQGTLPVSYRYYYDAGKKELGQVITPVRVLVG